MVNNLVPGNMVDKCSAKSSEISEPSNLINSGWLSISSSYHNLAFAINQGWLAPYMCECTTGASSGWAWLGKALGGVFPSDT